VVMNEPRSAPYLVEVTNRPGCAAIEASRHCFMAQPPRLGKAGNSLRDTLTQKAVWATLPLARDYILESSIDSG